MLIIPAVCIHFHISVILMCAIENKLLDID